MSSEVIGKVGQASTALGGLIERLRFGKTGAQVTTDAHGRYYEAASGGRVFYAASQAATTWTVALNATFTGILIANPAGSQVNLSLLQAGFGLSVAPAGIASVGLFGGYLAAGITTHTTPLTPASTLIGSPAGTAKADAAATLVGTPVWLIPFMGGFTAGSLVHTTPSLLDVGGSIVVPPGGYVGIGALTVVIGFGGLVWEEVPII